MVERGVTRRDKEILTPDPLRTAIIGAGNISSRYVENALGGNANIVVCADVRPEQAETLAAKYHRLQVRTPEAVFNDPTIDLIVNLTNPNAHEAVLIKALESGKHVYSEKPLATTLAGGKRIMEAAKKADLRVGCAPDTFLLPSIQTARMLIESGEIGEVIEANGHFVGNGPEHWHPNPEPFYQRGAGPLFDMGPYYITALVSMLGPIDTISARDLTEQRIRTTKNGEQFETMVPTNIQSAVIFASGASGNLTYSFDGLQSNMRPPHLEIIGTKARLQISDPNSYEVQSLWISRHEGHDWDQVPLVRKEYHYVRGLGLELFGRGIRAGKPSVMDSDMPLHVLDVMETTERSARRGTCESLSTTFVKPPLL